MLVVNEPEAAPMATGLPGWAAPLLACPETGAPLRLEGDTLLRPDGTRAATVAEGVVRFSIEANTDGIRHYKQIGGAHFHERRHAALSMSALDTPIYRSHIERFYGSADGLVVDIGGGDGRNAMPFVASGHKRVIVVDAVADALVRFRARLVAENPSWLERCLCIEADARALPLVSGCAERVLAIEALYYLNEDYDRGVREAARLLAPDGRLLLAERDYEGGLVMRALYFGIGEMLRTARTGDLWEDGPSGPVRTRSFTEAQLVAHLAGAGLKIRTMEGTPLLSLIMGWLARNASGGPAAESELREIGEVLQKLARTGRARRCHVAVAERA